MKVIDPGHKYILNDNKTGKENVVLTFYKDRNINGDGYEGTTNQEVIRALIDRIQFLDNQVPNRFNDEIITHLRAALGLHEMRHIERLMNKGVAIEKIECHPTHLVEANTK